MALTVLYDFCIMSVILFVAKILRSKIKFLQNLYIPSSLLAGFIGLICGKYGFNILPFSSEASGYSGILIAVLFATMFLGNKKKASFKGMLGNVGDTFLVNTTAEVGQYGIFMLLGALILPLLFPTINQAFGLMLPSGFIGGHGSAAAIGSALEKGGWAEATSVGQTFATIGLLCGIFIGVILINIGVKKKYTRVIKEIKELPNDIRTGLVDPEHRTSMGDNTVNPMSIDPLTWHLVLVLVAVGGAYLANMGLQKVFPQVSFPIYGLALICSVIIQLILKLIKMDTYVDKRVVTRIGSSATDYLVAFGVATINLNVVFDYWLPILILVILGILFCLGIGVVCKYFCRTFWFERFLYIFGMCTGVMATGVILLRIVDPEFKSGVLENFGLAWIFLTFIDLALVSLAPIVVLAGQGWVMGAICTAVAIACLVISAIAFGIHKEKGSQIRKGEEDIIKE